ncbi:MAG: radical SAM protein [Syntrophobacteraceae bacterium]
MEYYLIISKDCNLRCSYCYRAKGSPVKAEPDDALIKRTCDFILSNSNLTKRVTFHGGEPLLQQNIIKQFISAFEGHGITNILYTNGTLLDRIDPWILKKVSYITVSIDGNEDIHDKYRGQGTYQKIIGNIHKIRSMYNGHIMGRITLSIDSESSLDKAVISLLQTKVFDSINWQIQNSPGPFAPAVLSRFRTNYQRQLVSIISLWMAALSNGSVLNILPIQCAVRTCTTAESFDTFRCGCGTSLIFVDLTQEGACYACDELVDEGLYKIGSVSDGVVMPNNLKHASINSECAGCEIQSFCGGRCLRSCVVLPKNMFHFYCESVKIMYHSLMPMMIDIKKIIGSKKSLQEKVFCAALDLIEGIP